MPNAQDTRTLSAQSTREQPTINTQRNLEEAYTTSSTSRHYAETADKKVDSGAFPTIAADAAKGFAFDGVDYTVHSSGGDGVLEFTPTAPTSNEKQFCAAACDRLGDDCLNFSIDGSNPKVCTVKKTAKGSAAQTGHTYLEPVTKAVKPQAGKKLVNMAFRQHATRKCTAIGSSATSSTVPSVVAKATKLAFNADHDVYADVIGSNDGSDGVSIAVDGSTGVITFFKQSDNTDVALNNALFASPVLTDDAHEAKALICASACDVIPGCTAVHYDNSVTTTGVCTAYADCQIDSTAGDANSILMTADTGILDKPDALDKQHNWKAGFTVDTSGADDPVADISSTPLAITVDGVDYTVTTSGGVFTIKDGASKTYVPLQSEQANFCAQVCQKINAQGSNACTAFTAEGYSTGLKPGSAIKCTGFKTFANLQFVDEQPSEVALYTVGNSYVPGRLGASNAYVLHEDDSDGMKCTTTADDQIGANQSAADFTYEGVAYKVMVDDKTDGIMTFEIASASGTKDFSHIKADSNFDLSDGVYADIQGFCAAACDVITDCATVHINAGNFGDSASCVAWKSCTIATASGTPTQMVIVKATESYAPTPEPTNAPSHGPSSAPTKGPTSGPSLAPTSGPSQPPSTGPTVAPSGPTNNPSSGPSRGPAVPTVAPSGPTDAPTVAPSGPTDNPTVAPSKPTTHPSRPTKAPVIDPTPAPSAPTAGPTVGPTTTTTTTTVAADANAGEQTADTTSASSTIMALQVVVFLAWALF